MTEDDRRGEGFAFFHWVVAGFAMERCWPQHAGWGCKYCQQDWNELQGRGRSND